MRDRVRFIGYKHDGCFTVIPGPALRTAMVLQSGGGYKAEVLQANCYYEVIDGALAGTVYLVMR